MRLVKEHVRWAKVTICVMSTLKEIRAAGVAQAKELREQARAGGLRFEAYLPSSLADWLLEKVENGVFMSPSEAVFVFLGESRELEPHADLREELLKRGLQAAMDDPRPSIPHEEVMEKMRQWLSEPRPDPAVWVDHESDHSDE